MTRTITSAPPFFPAGPPPTDSRTLRLVLWLIFGLVAFLSVIGVAGVVTVTGVSPEHSGVVNGVLISILAPTLGAMVTLLVKVVLILIGRINGRFDQWMEQMEITGENRYQTGRAEGKAEILGKPEVLAATLAGSGFHVAIPAAPDPAPAP